MSMFSPLNNALSPSLDPRRYAGYATIVYGYVHGLVLEPGPTNDQIVHVPSSRISLAARLASHPYLGASTRPSAGMISCP